MNFVHFHGQWHEKYKITITSLVNEIPRRQMSVYCKCVYMEMNYETNEPQKKKREEIIIKEILGVLDFNETASILFLSISYFRTWSIFAYMNISLSIFQNNSVFFFLFQHQKRFKNDLFFHFILQTSISHDL